MLWFLFVSFLLLFGFFGCTILFLTGNLLTPKQEIDFFYKRNQFTHKNNWFDWFDWKYLRDGSGFGLVVVVIVVGIKINLNIFN